MLSLALAVTLLLGRPPAQERKPIYPQVIAQPDINNGYEDYLRAADMVAANHKLGLLSYWTPQLYEQLLAAKKEGGDAKLGEGWSSEDEARLSMAAALKDYDHLAIQRLIASEFAAPLERIKVGNQKRVWDPRPQMNAATTFPELAAFKGLAKLFRASAYVKLADGDSKGATQDLLDGLTFARRIGGGSIIADLVSIASSSILFAAFEENLARLTQKDAAKIFAYVDSALAEPPTFLQAMRREREFMATAVDELFQSPEGLGAIASDTEGMKNGLDKYVAAMSGSERISLKSSIAKRLNESFDKIDAQLRSEEANWANPLDNLLPPDPPLVANAQDCADAIINLICPVLSQATQAVMKTRAQLRLLGLHARIIDFRWQNTRLPKSLAEVASPKQCFDPFGKSAFHYEQVDGSYKLYSNGTSDTGPVELKYKRPTNLPSKVDDPIPPLASYRLGSVR